MKIENPSMKKMMFNILEHSCSNPVDYKEWEECNRPRPVGEERPTYTGWNEYRVETHCTLWKIIAKKVGDNWIIKEATAEDC